MSDYLRLLAGCRLPSGKHAGILTYFQAKSRKKRKKIGLRRQKPGVRIHKNRHEGRGNPPSPRLWQTFGRRKVKMKFWD